MYPRMKFIAALCIGMTAARQLNLDVDSIAVSETTQEPNTLIGDDDEPEEGDSVVTEETTSVTTNAPQV
jgi:hypothetical protein